MTDDEVIELMARARGEIDGVAGLYKEEALFYYRILEAAGWRYLPDTPVDPVSISAVSIELARLGVHAHEQEVLFQGDPGRVAPHALGRALAAARWQYVPDTHVVTPKGGSR